MATENLYHAATREIATKLENLNDEFKCTRDRNPIHHITTRVKSPRSIQQKLLRRGLPNSVESAKENLTDIAGVRVVCPYIKDIYLIADLLVGSGFHPEASTHLDCTGREEERKDLGWSGVSLRRPYRKTIAPSTLDRDADAPR